MWSRLADYRLIIAVVLSVAMLGVLACGGADEDEAPAPAAAPAPAVAPAPSSPSAPVPQAPAAPLVQAVVPEMEEASGEPALAGKYPTGHVKFNVTVAMPKSFSEAPMLAELVKAGKLPPLEERLPEEPLVLPPPEAIGKYGGTWNRIFLYVGDHGAVGTDKTVIYDGDGFTWMPFIPKEFDFSNGGRTVTITLRKGHKWSDGTPYTADDYEFQWNEMMLNEEWKPTFPVNFLSPQSKNQPTFEKLDDLTVRYTWDDPYYSIIERGFNGGFWSKGGGGYIFSPANYVKQFHPDFADKAELDKMMKDAQVDGWVKLMKIKLDAYMNTELPQLSAWVVVDDATGQEWIWERNPYYFAVDTAGNQLPYIDRQYIALVEDQQVAALKIAAGEVDFQSRNSTIEKIPVYLENAEKNGFHLTFWPNQDPTSATHFLNQAYEEDPLISELIRRRDFRIALSYAMDRKAVQETFFQGMGEIRGYAPSKGTPFFPGDEYAYPDDVMNRSVAKGNEILDSIVLKDGSTIKERNADGLRLRPDNGEVLTLNHDVRAGFLTDFTSVSEVAMRNWEELGIKNTLDFSRTAGNKLWDNEGYLFPYFSEGSDPWRSPDLVVPTGWWGFGWTKLGRFYSSAGKEGVNPDQDAFINPEGNNPLTRLLELYEDGKAYAINSPERKKLGMEMFQIHGTERFNLPTVADTPAMKGIFPTNNNFKNVPELTACCQGLWGDGPRPELYYFDNQ